MKKELASIAKITKPRLPKVLNRTRLFGLLDKGRHTSVTWVNGPAGSGKTTLIASWIEAKQLPCLWYQMDGGDADLATFFYYLGLAAKKAAPRFRKPLHLLTPEYMMDVPTFSRRYFEDLCVRVKTPFLIIFDNYQEVPPDSPLHAVLASGVAAIPEGVHVVCLSRTEPPSTYSGLIAGSKMEIIGWDDLRLRPDESRAIVGLHSEDKQARKTLEWMYNRTQGWAAGLVLLARAAKNQIIDPGKIDAFTPVKVFDYFVNELFGRLDKPTQDFLLKTAFMPKITPRLAEDLTGNKNAGQILSELNRKNYFTEKRLQPELSYQYHALFRDFLRSHAQKHFSETERNRLRIEAATLLQKAEMWDDAVDVYLEAGAWGSLVPLVLSRAHTLLDQGRSRTLHKWLASLPEAIKTTDPWVLYWSGICDMAFHPQQSHKLLEEAFELFDAQSNDVGRLLAWSGAADVALYSGEYAGLGEWLKRIEGLDVGAASFLEPGIAARVTLSIFNAMAYGFPGHRDIRQWTERTTDILYRAQDVNIDFQVQAGVTLGIYYVWKGDFFNGRIILDYLNDLCKRKALSDLSVLSVLTHNALYGCTTGDVGLALKSMDAALQHAHSSGVHVWDDHIICHTAAALLGAGELQRAEQLLAKISIRPGMTRRFDHGYYLTLRAWCYLLQEKAPVAYEYIPAVTTLYREVGAWVGISLIPLLSAEFLIEMGDYAKAERELHTGYSYAQTVGSKYFEYGYLIVTAHLEMARGKRHRCLTLLAAAFAIGREHQYWRHFIWRPKVMARLCMAALEANVETGYVRELIQRNNFVPEDSPLLIKDWPWPIRIYTLGRFELLKDDKPVQFTGKVQKKPLELLKVLVALGGKDVAEAQLMDDLWPDADGDIARVSFRTTLHRLRKLMGNDDAVQLKGGQVSVNAGYCWVDAWAFERMFDEALRSEDRKQQRQKSTISNQQSTIEKALALYKGQFLPDGAREPWAMSMREHMRSRFLQLTIALGRHWEGNKQYEKAVECYRQGLKTDGLAEEFYQHLMTCHSKRGQQAEAVKVYHLCRAMLVKSLGIEPSTKTEEIYSSLLNKK